mmetsp:Transcript_28867/g.39956  ORF Transcript_28867/g.39956 Transcript_28867/m.39956 type:complete len:162 (+) Transcript_28867:59-544(+)
MTETLEQYRCPISYPFSDTHPKLTAKLYSLVHKCHEAVQEEARQRNKKRGVPKGIKEVTKLIRLTTATNKKPGAASIPPGSIVLLGADTSPYDVVSHIPVLAEQAGLSYVWVPSRRDLGFAAGSRRPTSVVLLQCREAYAHSLEKCVKIIDKMALQGTQTS